MQIRLPRFLYTSIAIVAALFLIHSQGYGQANLLREIKLIQFRDSIVDSMDYNADSLLFYVPKYRQQQTQSFLDSLQNQASRNQLSKLAIQLLLSNSSKETSPKNNNTQEQWKKYEGKIINTLQIIQLDPFGTSLYDTSLHQASKLENFGNSVHIKTLETVLEDNIFVSEGDTLDINLLYDNERLLRRLGYLKDVRIVVRNVFGQPDRVNVYFITRDIFSFGFYWEIRDKDEGKFEVYDKNFLGTGHKLLLGSPYKSGDPGFKLSYEIDNIAGSFIKGKAKYENAFDNKKIELSINREFFSYRTQYAGEFYLSLNDKYSNIVKPDTVLKDIHLDYLTHDIWGARSFLLNKNLKGGRRTRLILALRGKRDIFFEGPQIQERYNSKFHDNSLLLSSIALSREKFYKTRFMYSFGVTEDIPVGSLVQITAGMEQDEFYKRNYFALQAGYGHFFPNVGFFHLHTNLGTYIYNKEPEQGTINARLEFISKLIRNGNGFIRQFFTINYLEGFNRFADEYIEMDNDSDIRGISLDKQFGQRKISFNTETVFFSDWYYYDFRFANYLFADMGFITRKNQHLFDSKPYMGIGFGLRIRNENLVFKTFQMRFAFYPTFGDVNSPFGFRITGAKDYNAIDYYQPNKPEIIPYE